MHSFPQVSEALRTSTMHISIGRLIVKHFPPVGPRPERPYFVNEFRKLIPHYDRRLSVKPGVTGLAQVRRGYDETLRDVKRKLKYDVLYAQKVCPFLDFKVIGLTVVTVLARTGR